MLELILEHNARQEIDEFYNLIKTSKYNPNSGAFKRLPKEVRKSIKLAYDNPEMIYELMLSNLEINLENLKYQMEIN